MVSRNWKCKEAGRVRGNVPGGAIGCWYVFNSRACLSPEINRFSRTNSSIRRTNPTWRKSKAAELLAAPKSTRAARFFPFLKCTRPCICIRLRRAVFNFWLFTQVGVVKRKTTTKKTPCAWRIHTRMTVTSVGSQLIWESARLLPRPLKWYRATTVSRNTSKKLEFLSPDAAPRRIFYIAEARQRERERPRVLSYVFRLVRVSPRAQRFVIIRRE